MYLLKAAEGKRDGTLVLQGSESGLQLIVEETCPFLKQKGIDLNVYYVASAELFDLLPEAEQEADLSCAPCRRGAGHDGASP